MRAVRGAIQVDRDDPVEVMDATRLLLREIIEANSLVPDDLVSILFTATPDIVWKVRLRAGIAAVLAALGTPSLDELDKAWDAAQRGLQQG